MRRLTLDAQASRPATLGGRSGTRCRYSSSVLRLRSACLSLSQIHPADSAENRRGYHFAAGADSHVEP